MTISAPLSGSADMAAPFPAITAADSLPRAEAHPSQPDLSGQHGLADKPEREAQQILRKLLGEGQVRSGLMAKPRRLPFGILPGCALRRRDRSFERHLAVQVAQ